MVVNRVQPRKPVIRALNALSGETLVEVAARRLPGGGFCISIHLHQDLPANACPMATTLRALCRNTSPLLFLILFFFFIPTHDSFAQVVCDPLVGLCTNGSPTQILQQTENDLQNENSTFQQTANELNNAESSMRAIYGATAYSGCYNQSAACSEDTATQLGASECVDTLQLCLQEYEKTLQEYQSVEAQPTNTAATAPQTSCPSGSSWIAAQSSCVNNLDALETPAEACQSLYGIHGLSQKNAQGQNICTCTAGYVMNAENTQCVVAPVVPVQSTAPHATQLHTSQTPATSYHSSVSPTAPNPTNETITPVPQHTATSNAVSFGSQPSSMASSTVLSDTTGVGPGFWSALWHLLDPFTWFK